jgi:ABC-type glycerol-3-phosphate transport system permease component
MHGLVRRRRIARGAVNALIAFFALFPILWGLSSSLKPTDRIIEFPPRLLPEAPTLEHYARIFADDAAFYSSTAPSSRQPPYCSPSRSVPSAATGWRATSSAAAPWR